VQAALTSAASFSVGAAMPMLMVVVSPLGRVLRAARHLLASINDILDLSKIESGKMELSTETFSVACPYSKLRKPKKSWSFSGIYGTGLAVQSVGFE
jgi:signal transduction histidine kinase